jgi:hypothetical protein
MDDNAAQRLYVSFYGMGSALGKARIGRPSKTYEPNGTRECERRIRQNATFNQVKSHQYRTARPKHVFGDQ